MSEKRPDETQAAFTVRQIRDDEAERCARIAEESADALWRHGKPSADYNIACLQIADAIRARVAIRASADAIRQRIAARAT